VRVWRTDQGGDQEPEVATEADRGITSISTAVRIAFARMRPPLPHSPAQPNCWITGSEDGEVRRYTKNVPNLEGLVTHVAALAVRCVAVDPTGKKVAVTSEYFHFLLHLVAFRDM